MNSALGIILRGGMDSDALRYIVAAGLTDPLQRNTANWLTKQLKSAGLWTLMAGRGFWPLMGGTAASHSQNLISSSFAVTWSGGVTHNANGITGNGVDGFGSMANVGSGMAVNNFAAGMYTKTVASSGNAIDFGGTPDAANWLIMRSQNNAFAWLIGNTSAGSGPATDGLPGARIISSNGTIANYERGTAVGSARTAAGTVPPTITFLRAANAGDYSNATVSAGFVSTFLTPGQAVTMSQILLAMQQKLGRA